MMDRARPRAGTFPRAIIAALIVGALVGCLARPPTTEDESDAFYSRNRAELYDGLEPDAPAVAVLDFDTRARILETHRSFAKVRTSAGQEGWMPKDLLLDGGMRRTLRDLTKQTASLPGQGRYRAHDTLNVHTLPYRWAPTFYQLEKDEGFEMLDRVLVDRLPAIAATARTPPEPTGLDHWYLVRLPGIRQTGWLIANMAYADIPLEVAMLAAGHPIVAYFPIGSVTDEETGEARATWLWFQSVRREQAHDFDRMMVLRWDASRQRYAVMHRASNLTGYLPVEIEAGFESEHGEGVRSSVVLDKSGDLFQRTDVYTANRAYQLEERPVVGALPHVPPSGFGTRYEFSARLQMRRP